MKNSLVKRTLSIVLSVIMLISCVVSVLAASEKDLIYPVIIVGGIDANPLVSDPNTENAGVVFPPDDVEISYYIGKLITLMNTAIATNDYDEILNYTYSWVYPIMEKISMNNDGTNRSNNVGVTKYTHSLSYYRTDEELVSKVAGTLGKGMAEKIGYNNIYVFQYDWRLDPFENADNLAQFVSDVKKMSHMDKVSIVAEGYGANVAVTYLSSHSDTAYKDVTRFVTVGSTFMGTSLIGDLFTGNIIVKDSSFSYPNNVGYGQFQYLTSAFIRWTNDFSDNPITAFSTWLTNYILNGEWETQAYIINIMTMMGHTITKMYDKYLRDMLRNYLGLWSMVPLEYYDDAIEYMFMDQEEPNAKLVKKIEAYKKLQANGSKILQDAQKAGMDVSVVSLWDLQLLPIGNDYMSSSAGNDEIDPSIDMANELYGLSAQSDGVVDTYYSSFGAYCTSLNDVGRATLHKQIADTDHNHLSKNYDKLDPKHKLGAVAHYIDASTCALPENTYFIRNMKHGTFEEGSNSIDFITWLACTEDTSINSKYQYSQFMYYNRYVDPGILVDDMDPKDDRYLLGDVNVDGKVTAADARLALRIAARLETMPEEGSIPFKNADVNKDGKITTSDARIILRVVARLQNF